MILLMTFMLKKLEVYQKAVDFTDQIAALTEGFPRGSRRPVFHTGSLRE